MVPVASRCYNGQSFHSTESSRRSKPETLTFHFELPRLEEDE